jgi:hypothetical protein
VHGFNSATNVHDISEDDDGRPLIILYVGDFDPSGMYMSKADSPKRFANYDSDHISVKRIALTRKQVRALPEIAPELTGHGLPLSKCEAYNRVYDQFYRSR